MIKENPYLAKRNRIFLIGFLITAPIAFIFHHLANLPWTFDYINLLNAIDNSNSCMAGFLVFGVFAASFAAILLLSILFETVTNNLKGDRKQ